LRLLNQPIEIPVGQSSRYDAGAGFPASRDNLGCGLNRDRHTLIRADPPPRELGRDFAGRRFDDL